MRNNPEYTQQQQKQKEIDSIELAIKNKIEEKKRVARELYKLEKDLFRAMVEYSNI